MTQRALADALGFAAQSYVNALETGKKIPNAALLLKVSTLFGVPTDHLLRDDLDLAPEDTTTNADDCS
jgi:transcriptional regulator with XRE-family HTH domain